jgi:hypothetical protein
MTPLKANINTDYGNDSFYDHLKNPIEFDHMKNIGMCILEGFFSISGP